MNRKHLSVNHIEISYLENHTEKAEHTLFFVHGNSMSAALFKPLLQNPALSCFRIISLDLPGHGENNPVVNPDSAYRFNALKYTIVSFVEKLGIDKLILLGHSLGGHLCIQLLPMLQEKVEGLVICGTPPLTSLTDGLNAFSPSVAMQHAYTGELTTEELNQLALAIGGNKHFETIKTTIQKCDPLFRPTLGASLKTDSFANEQSILSLFKPKTLVFHGENDNLIQLDYLKKLNPAWLYQNNIQVIPNAGHLSFMDNTHYFIKTLVEYIDCIKY